MKSLNRMIYKRNLAGIFGTLNPATWWIYIPNIGKTSQILKYWNHRLFPHHNEDKPEINHKKTTRKLIYLETKKHTPGNKGRFSY